ncbi:unnamed protein product [Thlaspi arvense]|uniref:Cytochrome c oxidase subunit 6a n=1 Tax=Thlaspi arvense TaxID=13288 RepID=A0AAU9T2G5_THLAR|nr:unnamed protein product [Thlaspi arvense]
MLLICLHVIVRNTSGERERRETQRKLFRRMATAIVRSALSRAAISAAPRTSVAPKRSFSASAGHDDAYEAAKWEKITYLGIASCTALAAYVLSKGHHHGEDPPAYPYMHIRNKEFPWGMCAFPVFNLSSYCFALHDMQLC